MRPQAIILIAGFFLLAGALLFFGPSGYEKLDDLQSLAAQTTSIREAFPEVEHISPRTLSYLRVSGVSLLIVDVRTGEEYSVSHIRDAINLKTAAEVEKELESRIPAPDLIVVYGSIGKRSAELADELRRAGHPGVRNLAGSIFQWANEGRPLVGPEGKPATKVLSAARYQKLLLDPERRAEAE